MDDIRAMCAEVDRKEAEDCLYLRWVLQEQALILIAPWVKKKLKPPSFDDYKKRLQRPARASQKPDRAAFHAAYGAKIKTPEGVG